MNPERTLVIGAIDRNHLMLLVVVVVLFLVAFLLLSHSTHTGSGRPFATSTGSVVPHLAWIGWWQSGQLYSVGRPSAWQNNSPTQHHLIVAVVLVAVVLVAVDDAVDVVAVAAVVVLVVAYDISHQHSKTVR